MLLRLFDFTVCNTEKISVSSILSFIFGYNLPQISAVDKADYIFYMQMIAYLVSIIVGLLAVCGYLYKFYMYIVKKEKTKPCEKKK